MKIEIDEISSLTRKEAVLYNLIYNDKKRLTEYEYQQLKMYLRRKNLII